MTAHRQQSLCKEKDWLTTWSQSQKGLGLFPINDNGHTVAYQLPIQNKGEKVRLSLGNYYGETSTVIVSLGVNDIHQPGTDGFFSIEELPTYEEMVSGFEQLIEIAHRHGSRIILATVSPFIGYAKDVKNLEKEKLRQDINTWIRQNDLSDGHYDFHSILADEDYPSQLVLKYDSGDKLHPSAKGGQAMVELINIDGLLA